MALNPPVAIPDGQAVAWLRPTVANVLQSDARVPNYIGLPLKADGNEPTTGSSAICSSFWNNFPGTPPDYVDAVGPYWGLIYSGFNLHNLGLPPRSVITAIYGCYNVTAAVSGGQCVLDVAVGRIIPDGIVYGMWDWDGIGGAGQALPIPPLLPCTDQQFNSLNVVGVLAYSPDLTRAQFCVRWFETLYQAQSDGMSALFNIHDLALAIYYVPGPEAPKLTIAHGCNLNAYDNGGYLDPVWPAGLGELLWDVEPMRNWCRANSISVSNNQDSQRLARDIVEDLLMIGNSAPVYSGANLKTIPWDEVSGAGNGAIYRADTQPKFHFTDRDYVRNGENPPVEINRPRRVNCDNVIAIEHIDRTVDYAHSVTSEVDDMSVALYGPRKSGTLDGSQLSMKPKSGALSLLWLHSRENAQKIASIKAKVSATGLPEIAFTVGAQHMHREAMDVGTMDEPTLGWLNYPIRLKSVKENPDTGNVDILAEPFIYGLHHPDVRGTSKASGTLVQNNVDPGLVNEPIIFEPPTDMLPAGSGPQVWMLVSGEDENYGGCIGYVSVDGGATYEPLGNIGPAITGVLTEDYPLNTDPDTTDALKVDLTESNGEIVSQSTAIADGFADPCYVAGETGSIGVEYEVVCPTFVTLTSSENFTMDTYIRRAVQGTLAMDHPIGMRFGVISQALKTTIPAQWLGKTVLLKFAAYNKLGSQQNSLADCVAYPFTITGGPSAQVYINGVATSFDDEVYINGELISAFGNILINGVVTMPIDIRDDAPAPPTGKKNLYIQRDGSVTPAKASLYTDKDVAIVSVSASGTSAFAAVETTERISAGSPVVDITRTLPAATGTGNIFNYKKIDSTTYNIIVTAAGSDTVDGLATYTLVNQYQFLRLQDAASGKWDIIGGNY